MNIPVELMKIESQIILKKNSESIDFNSLFNPGKIISATIKKIIGTNTIKLQVGKNEVIAKTMTPLKAGDTIKVKNISLSDKPVLKIIEGADETKQATNLKNLFDKDLPGLLASLKNKGRGFPFTELTKIIATLSNNDEKIATSLPGKNNLKDSIPIKNENTGKKILKTEEIKLDNTKLTGETKETSHKKTDKNIGLIKHNSIKKTTHIKPDQLIENFKSKIEDFKKSIEFENFPKHKNLLKKINSLTKLLDKNFPMQENKTGIFISDNNFVDVKTTENQIVIPDNSTKDLINTFLDNLKNPPDQLTESRSLNNLIELIKEDITKINNNIFKNITIKKESPDEASILMSKHDVKINIKKLISKISLNFENIHPDDLKSSLDSSGLRWENKLKNIFSILTKGQKLNPAEVKKLMFNDLKAFSMFSENFFLNNSSDEKHTKTKVFKDFVDSIEKFQLANHKSGEESGKYLLPLPFFSGNEFKTGELFLDTGDPYSNTKKDRTIRVAFLLELSSMGNLMADFSVYNKAISGYFGVQGKSEKETLEKMLPDFEKRIKKSGFNIKKINCEIIEKQELTKKTFFDEMLTDTEGSLNIVI